MYWDVYFEKSLTKKRPEPRGCLEPILVIVFLALIVIALRNCETRDPKQPPGERPPDRSGGLVEEVSRNGCIHYRGN